MKMKSRKICLLLVVMAVTINLCSFTTVFATGSKQIALAKRVPPIAAVNNVLPTAAVNNVLPTAAVNNVLPTAVVNGPIVSGIGILPVYYTVVNVTALAPEWVNVGVADGIPTMTLTINKSKRVAVTYSATYGATYGQINTAVGWTYGEDVTIAIAGQYRVPKTYNGHKVKSGTLIAYAERSVKSYQIERHNEVGGITRSTGTAKKIVNHLCYKVILRYTDGGSVTISV